MIELSDAEKAAQLIHPGHKFGIDDPEEAETLTELGVGGFCLYGGRPEEVAAFTERLQKKARRPLLFSGDYEDGVATQCPGATALPSNMGLGASADPELAQRKAELTAVESLALGVPWVLAPVCDLASRAENPIVNTRSFGADPQLVERMARGYLEGLRRKKALSCLKHFPGHGATTADSHLELPTIPLTREELESRDMAPFRALAQEADGVMTGHLTVPALLGDKTPYSISQDPAKSLRGRLGFKGLISTDALAMQAIASNFDEHEASLSALRGGSDVLLVPARARELVRSLADAVAGSEELAALARAAYARLETARAACGFDRGAPGVDPSLVGSAAHQKEAEALAESCLAWAGAAVGPLKTVRYFELGGGPGDWFGQDFFDALCAAGVAAAPHDPGRTLDDDETLLVGTFLSPRAYTGRIAFDEDEAAELKAALAPAAARGKALIVSFGSPFVFDSLGVGGLCAFTRSQPAQRAAAKALAGRLAVRGRMPVAMAIR